jgi:hypothetical protein
MKTPEGKKAEIRTDIHREISKEEVVDELYRAVVCGVLTVGGLAEILKAVVSATKDGYSVKYLLEVLYRGGVRI